MPWLKVIYIVKMAKDLPIVIDDRARLFGQYDFIFDHIIYTTEIQKNLNQRYIMMDKTLVELFVCLLVSISTTT